MKSAGADGFLPGDNQFSAKSDNLKEASGLHGKLIEMLEEKGILLHEDSLKTQKVLSTL